MIVPFLFSVVFSLTLSFVFANSQLQFNLHANSLPASTGVTLLGAAATDNLGLTGTVVGDVNNDGYEDVFVGAYHASNNQRLVSGSSYLLYGSSQGLATTDLASLTFDKGFRIDGAFANDLSGFSVTSVDLNHDGYSDLVVSSYVYSPVVNSVPRYYAGKVFIVFGKSARSSNVDLQSLSSTDGFTIIGAEANDYTGYSLSNAGDINGDGIDDLLIGAYYASRNGKTYNGLAYVIYGSTKTFPQQIDLFSLTSAQGFRIIGANSNSWAGSSVSNARDFNHDGINDILIGAYLDGDRNQGITYLIFGKSNYTFSTIDLANLPSSTGIRILGATPGDQLGYSLSAGGDINGDGIDDIVIGANFFDAIEPHTSNGGAAYFIYGVAGIRSDINLTSFTSSQGFLLYGDIVNYNLGCSVSGGTDINRDGYNDMIIGANQVSWNTTQFGGAAFVILGRPAEKTSVIYASKMKPSDGFHVYGVNANDKFGTFVNSHGDINGDGYADMLIGAPFNTPISGRTNAGAAYVIYGGEYYSYAKPTQAPSPLPTKQPTVIPTAVPTSAPPSRTPTTSPSWQPTYFPSPLPTAIPSGMPTEIPSHVPTATPSAIPSAAPSAIPTAIPTEVPTFTPSFTPSAQPTYEPTATPTATPSELPTAVPSAFPTFDPSAHPTATPTFTPTEFPTTPKPSIIPTVRPTSVAPTSIPTVLNPASIVYYLNTTLSRVLLPSVTVEGKHAVELTYHNLTGLPLEDVLLISVVKITPDPVTNTTTTRRRGLGAVSLKEEETYTLIVNMKLRIQLQYYPSNQDAPFTVCYNMQENVVKAVNQGRYINTLRFYAAQENATELLSVILPPDASTEPPVLQGNCTMFNATTPEPTQPPAPPVVQDTGSPAPTTIAAGLLAMIVILSVCCCSFCFFCFFFGIRRYREEQEKLKKEEEMKNADEDDASDIFGVRSASDLSALGESRDDDPEARLYGQIVADGRSRSDSTAGGDGNGRGGTFYKLSFLNVSFYSNVGEEGENTRAASRENNPKVAAASASVDSSNKTESTAPVPFVPPSSNSSPRGVKPVHSAHSASFYTLAFPATSKSKNMSAPHSIGSPAPKHQTSDESVVSGESKSRSNGSVSGNSQSKVAETRVRGGSFYDNSHLDSLVVKIPVQPPPNSLGGVGQRSRSNSYTNDVFNERVEGNDPRLSSFYDTSYLNLTALYNENDGGLEEENSVHSYTEAFEGKMPSDKTTRAQKLLGNDDDDDNYGVIREEKEMMEDDEISSIGNSLDEMHYPNEYDKKKNGNNEVKGDRSRSNSFYDNSFIDKILPKASSFLLQDD
mmetsp:Transcript_27875/g.30457  ORF Transcript_27875/g.30457 Transcript_27875/m.30457 type:complete len:1314 (+) Transcript_27875:27-3968(+)